MEFPRKIYAIQHNVTKRMYIGSTKNVDSRYLNHIYKLRAGKHPVEDMQEDFIKYGEDYSLFVLEEITEYQDRMREFEWMHKYNTITRGIGYNYKDQGREAVCLKNTPPYKEGKPVAYEHSANAMVAAEYRDQIIARIEQSEDIAVLDFIYQFLKKRGA